MSVGVFRPVPQIRLPVLDVTKFAPSDPPFDAERFSGPDQDAAFRRERFAYESFQPAQYEIAPFAVQVQFPFAGFLQSPYRRDFSYVPWAQPESFSAAHYPADPVFPPELHHKRPQGARDSSLAIYWTQPLGAAVFSVQEAFPFPGIMVSLQQRADSVAPYVHPRQSMSALMPAEPIFPNALFQRGRQGRQELASVLYWTQRNDASIFSSAPVFPFQGALPQWQQSAYSAAAYIQPKVYGFAHFAAEPYIPGITLQTVARLEPTSIAPYAQRSRTSVVPFLSADPIYPGALFGNWRRQASYPQPVLIWQQPTSIVSIMFAPQVVVRITQIGFSFSSRNDQSEFSTLSSEMEFISRKMDADVS